MDLYLLAICIHVVFALLGAGPVAALAASLGPDGPSPATARALLRLATWSLVIVLVTGLAMVGLTGGAIAKGWWFHLSSTLFLAVGALVGVASAKLRKTGDVGAARTLTRIATALVVVIIVLMQAKPGA